MQCGFLCNVNTSAKLSYLAKFLISLFFFLVTCEYTLTCYAGETNFHIASEIDFQAAKSLQDDLEHTEFQNIPNQAVIFDHDSFVKVKVFHLNNSLEYGGELSLLTTSKTNKSVINNGSYIYIGSDSYGKLHFGLISDAANTISSGPYSIALGSGNWYTYAVLNNTKDNIEYMLYHDSYIYGMSGYNKKTYYTPPLLQFRIFPQNIAEYNLEYHIYQQIF